jgi:hypothetical protein
MFKVLVLLSTVALSFGAYCDAGNQQAEDSNLGPVQLQGEGDKIDDTHNCPGGTGVQYEADKKATLAPGGTYELKFDVTTCDNGYARKNAAWIDFNGNEKFDEWEKIGEQDVGDADKDHPQHLTFKFNVPSKTVPKPSNEEGVVLKSSGSTPTSRLRVMVVENGFDPMDPCLVFPYGGVKDFPILIGSASEVDTGGLLLIIVVSVAFVGFFVAMGLCFKLKQVTPKEFVTEKVLPPVTYFCTLVKAGCLFTAYKLKIKKGGDGTDYDEL